MALLQLYKGIADFPQEGASKKDLQFDYIDLYIIHWPLQMKKDSMTFELANFLSADIPSTWKSMTAVYLMERQRAKEGSANVADLEDMYENKRGPKKVQVRWFLMLMVQNLHADTSVVRGTERISNFGEQQGFLKVHSGAEYRKKIAYEPYCPDIKYYMFSRSLCALKNGEFSKSWEGLVLKVDEELELLSKDRDIRGCWIRITISEIFRERAKVQYDDWDDQDGDNNLEEWLPVFGLATPDKLGVKGPR
ncbi:hypothetical protein Nepgr_024157 [Nepenthes gracilis]|uniref:Agenet-like domain-containing protein n=1 Tax=Nepenthes gracilis TaxID=150966 RepID=A0AAD3T429_NEPGR|nr:hypothetical protein Nepgr_024157 [Nepenthes gracilis]